MDNQLYLPEPPALQKADMREMELLKERKQFRQQTHAEDLERTMRRHCKKPICAKWSCSRRGSNFDNKPTRRIWSGRCAGIAKSRYARNGVAQGEEAISTTNPRGGFGAD